MKSFFKKNRDGFLTLFLVITGLFWLLGTADLEARGAEAKKGEEGKGNPTPVHITSDKMLSDQKEKWVEFIGNVRATQEGSVINADSIKIFYKGQGESGSGEIGSQAVEKLIAKGQVKILFDEKTKTAMAEKAEYDAAEKILVLSGGNPSVQSGQDVIRGEKITLYQAENRTEVVGGAKKQVEATFHSQGEGGLIE